MPHHHPTWVVVANSTNARFFRLVQFPKIEEFETLVHPESRLHARDLVSNKPGRTFDRTGMQRHAYDDVDPKQQEVEKFAKHVGDYLKEAFKKGEFMRLYTIASPAFLGMLRPHFDPKIEMIAEIAKDMTDFDKSEIEKQLVEI